MIRRMHWLRSSLTLTAMFLFIVTVGTVDTGVRGQEVTLIARFIRDYFVDPMTLPGALVFVFVFSSFCYALFPGNADRQRQR